MPSLEQQPAPGAPAAGSLVATCIVMPIKKLRGPRLAIIPEEAQEYILERVFHVDGRAQGAPEEPADERRVPVPHPRGRARRAGTHRGNERRVIVRAPLRGRRDDSDDRGFRAARRTGEGRHRFPERLGASGAVPGSKKAKLPEKRSLAEA
jgi:hypothetical protein